MDLGQEQQVRKLPEGKKSHFFIVAAEEDRDAVLKIISSLTEHFKLMCLYEQIDCHAGQDKFDFIKTGMKLSAKVVLFLSQKFFSDGMCKLQKNMALAASLDAMSACIVPVLIDEVDKEMVTEIAYLTFIDAKDSEVVEIAGKIADSVSRPDFEVTMFPNECTHVFARFENGYGIEIQVRREALSCNRPSKYKFHVNQTFRTLLNDSKMRVPEELLEGVVKLVNKQSIMKSYDFLKKRNICCWGFGLLTPFAVLLCALLFMIVIVATCTRDRPDPEWGLLENGWILLILVGAIGNLYAVVIVILVLAIPRIYHREKEHLENFILRRQMNRNNVGENMTVKEYADHLIKQEVVEMSKQISKSYDDLLDTSDKRHNVRKGKMCVCEQIELHLRSVQEQVE